MFIDTHCHIDLSAQKDLYIKDAYSANVKGLIFSFCNKDCYQEGVNFLNQCPDVFVSLGFHPEEADVITDEDLQALDNVLTYSSRIVAIGEIGLDYYWRKDNKDQQRNLFKKQLDLAVKHQMPVVVHCREAIQELYDILFQYQGKVKGVIHCFSGSYEMALRFIELGFVLGIGGVLTFKNSKLYQVVEKLPLSSIVLETDSPYLTPEPHRGEVNESKYIPIIAEKIAQIKHVPLSEVERITTANAQRVFDLPI
ncbi:MAG TPA: TatD family hydrolase [Candidatus Scybalousia intestinigallinarum]|nr:TatD family hydrolase [Candidatus Scybalousia intestinigallinarum]